MSKKKPNMQLSTVFPLKFSTINCYAKQLNSYTTAGMEKPSPDTVGIKMSYGVKLIFFQSDLAKILKL